MANIPTPTHHQSPQWHLLCSQSAGIPASLDAFVAQMPVRADGSWAAPCALVDGGRQFVFFEEALATQSGRTRISLLETDADGRAAIVRPVIEHEGAVGAPFVFNWQERFWLLAVRDGVPWLYRCLRWPERWQPQAPLLADGVRFTAGSLHWHDGLWWLWLNQARNTGSSAGGSGTSDGGAAAAGACGSGGAVLSHGCNSAAAGDDTEPRLRGHSFSGCGEECLHLYSAKHLSGARWQSHPINGAHGEDAGSVFSGDSVCESLDAGQTVSAATPADERTAVAEPAGNAAYGTTEAAEAYGTGHTAELADRARPASCFPPSAGCVFVDAQGRLLRPVRTKGGCGTAAAASGQADAITFYHVTTLTADSYVETAVHRLELPAGQRQIRRLNIGTGCAWADAAF